MLMSKLGEMAKSIVESPEFGKDVPLMCDIQNGRNKNSSYNKQGFSKNN